MIRATPRVQTRARQIAKATGSQPVLSYATADAELPNAENVHAAVSAEPMKVHACSTCGTQSTVSAALHEPHCINCGSPHSKCVTTAATMPKGIEGDKDLSAVQCGSCKSTTIVENRVLSAVQSVHCSACGSHMKPQLKTETAGVGPGIQLPEAGDPPAAPVTLDAPNTTDTRLDMKRDDSNPEVPNDQAVKVEAEADDEVVELTDQDIAEIESMGGDDLPGDDVVLSWTDEVPADDGADVVFSADDGVSDEPALEEAVGAEDIDQLALAAEMTGDEAVKEECDAIDGLDDLGLETFDAADALDMPETMDGDPLMDTVGLDDTIQACYMIQAGSKLIAMKGHHSIATLTKERAGKNADVMFSDSFPTAVLSHANQVGMRKALATFGFAPIRTKVQSNVTVQRQVAAVKAQAADQVTAFNKTYADALALAAAGLARGMFKGVANPLKVAMEQEFQAAGIRRPGRVAAQILTEQGMSYAHTLSVQAQRIAAMSEGQRKQLAEVLDIVSEVPESPELDEPVTLDANAEEMPNNEFDYDDETVASVTARLSNPATPQRERSVAALFKPGQRVIAAADASAQADALAVLSGTQPLNFNV